MNENATQSGLNAAEKRVLLVTCPCHFLCHFFILVFPSVTMPLVLSLGMPLEEVVRLSFMMYVMFGLCALPAGLIVDRWGARWMLIMGLFLMGSGLLLAGLFPGPGSMYWMLGIVGVGASIYHPAGIGLISRTVRQRGYALGINGIFGNLGIASAPLVTGLLTWQLGWQGTFISLGAFGLFTALVMSFIPVEEKTARKSPAVAANRDEVLRYFVILCVGLICAGIAYRGNMLLLPSYLELKAPFFHKLVSSVSSMKPQGTATLAATILTSLVLVTGIFGQMMGGKLADRMDLRRAYLMVHAASLPFILAMAFVSDYAVVVAAAGYAFFSLGMQPIENSLIAALTPEKWRSTSYATKFILNFGVGASAVYIISPIKKAFSLEIVYVFLAGVTGALILSIITLIISSRRLATVRN